MLKPRDFLALAEIVAAAARFGEGCTGVLAGDPCYSTLCRCHAHRTLTLVIDRLCSTAARPQVLACAGRTVRPRAADADEHADKPCN